MATRLNPKHDAATRDKIQTSQLINRLNSFALGDPSVEIDATRLRAIEILLRKALPDLQSVQITGTGTEGELVVQIERTIVKASN